MLSVLCTQLIVGNAQKVRLFRSVYFTKLETDYYKFMTMKRITIIILALIWISSLIILIIALTDIVPNNPFKDYRLIVGIAFLVLSSFIRIAYQKLVKAKQIIRILDIHIVGKLQQKWAK